MANFRVMTSPLSFTPTATSQNSASFPVTNITIYSNLGRRFEAGSAGLTNITLDFGSGTLLSTLTNAPAIFIDDTNVLSLSIQGNSVSSWTSPPWNQSIAILKDSFSQRRKGFFRLSDLSVNTFGYRYLNLQISSQTTTDSRNYRIGRTYVGSATELIENPLYDVLRKFVDPVATVDLMDGGQEVNLLGSRYFACQFRRQVVGSREIEQELDLHAITPGSPIVLWDSSPDLGGTQHAWMMRRVQDPEFTQTIADIYEDTWTFKEIT